MHWPNEKPIRPCQIFDNVLKYSAFTLAWIIVNDFQVELFSFNYRKQWKLSVVKKLSKRSKTLSKLEQGVLVRVNGLQC